MPDYQSLGAIKRRSRVSALISGVGALLVFTGIGVSIYQVRGLRQEVSSLEVTKARLTHQIEEQNKAMGALGLQPGQGSSVLESKLNTYFNLKTTMPRVFFQIRGEIQKPVFHRCEVHLERLGYKVPAPEVVPISGPRIADVRYFKRADYSAAKSLALALHTCIPEEIDVKYMPGYERSSKISDLHFEVFLARSLG